MGKARGEKRSRVPLVVLGNPGKRKGPTRCFRYRCDGEPTERLEHLEQCLIHPQLWAAACRPCARAVREGLERYSLTFPPYALCSVCAGVNGASQLTLFSNGEALLWVCKYCNSAQKSVLQANLFLRQDSVPAINSVESIVSLGDSLLSSESDRDLRSSSRKRPKTTSAAEVAPAKMRAGAEPWRGPGGGGTTLATARDSLSRQPIANMAEFAKLLENFRVHDELLTKLVISHREQYTLLLNLSNRVGADEGSAANERLKETNALLMREVELLRSTRQGSA